jgi:hypothetical protein
MPVKLPQRLLSQLDKRIKEQEKRVARAQGYLDELRYARSQMQELEVSYCKQAEGGQQRALILTPERRAEIARHGANVRWGKKVIP